jgi:ubiquinone/menaquinone biosynthesis C-methylase UbiE
MPNSTTETRRVQRIYDRIAPQWDARQGRVENRMLGDTMRQTLAESLHGDVLEIGTGTGVTLRRLAGNTRVTSFTGTDLSSGMLDQSRPLVETVPFPVALREMDADHLDFPDASFDTVTTSLTLCTVPDPARTLREMARLCKPGGTIAILEHVLAPNPLVAIGMKFVAPIQRRAMGCNLDRRTDRLVGELGFEVDRHESRFLGIFHLIIARPPA